MKILVLGNGFDLDHNLPTSYMDFLNFCNYVTERTEESFNKLKPTQEVYAEILKTDLDLKNTFSLLLKNNYLLKYFNSRVATQGENWIDFEREIKSVVNEFKAIEFEFKQSNQYSYKIDKNHKINIILKDLGLDNHIKELWGENELFIIHQKLCYSLDNFSKALEYYISLLINNIPVKGVAPDIVDFGADKVITFNYSNTYERVYGDFCENEVVDHIHGATNKPLNKEANIILGITTNNKNLQNYYVEFEKYYQRITKRTGNKYKKWLQQGKEINEEIEVMFFGHSLDATDSDIIKDLFFYNNSVIKIYYFDERSYQQIVANLIEIMGKDDLIDFVSGSNPKIEFIQQQKHRYYDTAGIEITHDTNILYRLHTLSSTEINGLIYKITEKIKSKELSYFYSQRKVISLFEALYCNSLKPLTFTWKDFLNVCEAFNFERNKNGDLILYDESEWYHISSQGSTVMQRCDIETSWLITEINISNKKRFQQYELSKPYAEILTLKSSEEIKCFLLNILRQDCPYNNYGKQLRELFKPMYEKKDFFEEAFNLIEKTNLSNATRVKFRCFKKDYDEFVDNIEYKKVKSNKRK